MPIDTMSMPIDETLSFDNTMSFDITMSFDNTMSMSMPFFGDTEMFISSNLCHPSCPAHDSSSPSSVGGIGSWGNGGGGGSSKNVNPTEVDAVPDINGSKKSWKPVVASILGVAGVVALAGVTYKVVAQKNAATAAGGDELSLSSVDTPLA
jgi:hypothetical protein